MPTNMLHLSAQDALKLARTNVDNARNARGSTATIIRHYRAVKKALYDVDALKADLPTLREMIVVFKDLAVVLDHSVEQERAAKCRQRAGILR